MGVCETGMEFPEVHGLTTDHGFQVENGIGQGLDEGGGGPVWRKMGKSPDIVLIEAGDGPGVGVRCPLLVTLPDLDGVGGDLFERVEKVLLKIPVTMVQSAPPV